MRRNILFLVLTAVLGPCRFLPEPVAAESSTRALALAVAQVAAHEGALQNPRDVDLIWQCVTTHGDTPEDRLRWLQGHSPRALGLKPPKPWDGNAWSSELDHAASVPASIAAGADRGSLAYWRVKVMPRWSEVLERAQRLVSGAPYEQPCSVKPLTWGGLMDHEHAAAKGLFPIGCKGTLNDGFTTRDALKAAVD